MKPKYCLDSTCDVLTVSPSRTYCPNCGKKLTEVTDRRREEKQCLKV